MMAGLAAAFVAASGAFAVYEPVQVGFAFRAPGNPYDGEVNDIQVVFRQGDRTERRLAYYESGRWMAWFAAPAAGVWEAHLERNGRLAGPQRSVRVTGDASTDSFIRIDPVRNRFQTDDGVGWFPIGHNLGWQSPGLPDITEQIGLMADNGINWSRIWACHWDGKNPYMMPDPEDSLNQWAVNEGALRRWDDIVAASAEHDVRMQFVLFHHGLFSQRVNPNWQDHPWNKANGGWLEDPANFFTDARAKKLSKNWLRIAVARYGHSRGIMAWELFNEVEWVDARYQDRWPDIVAWHNEMAAHLRSMDPHGRLVTTSSELGHGLYTSMDFQQPHTYPADITAALLGVTPDDPAKPLFFGEFGPSGAGRAEEEGMAIRDGIWAGVFGGHAGAGQYWFWDRVYPEKLYGEFKVASDLLGRSPDYLARTISAEADMAGDAVLAFGRGWAATDLTEISLPADITSGALGRISSYLQGDANRTMFPKPLVIRATLRQASELKINTAQVSSSGGALRISVNGEVKENQAMAAGEGGAPNRQTITVPLPAGAVTIEIANPGADWVNLARIEIKGAGPAVLAYGAEARSGDDWIVRLKRAPGAAGNAAVRLQGLPQGWPWSMHSLDSGQSVSTGAGNQITLPSAERDVLVRFRRPR
jgi:hypothetical protein